MVPGAGGGLEAVPLSCSNFYTAMQALPVERTPPDYVSVAAVEPGMGNHLLDLTHPVFSGQTFDHVWIWGAWAGELAYFEPMVTKAYLESIQGSEKQCVAIKMPQTMAKDGWYPTEYCMEYKGNLDVYRVSLEAWSHFNASLP